MYTIRVRSGPATFRTSDVAEWTGTTRPQLEHWYREGVMTPEKPSRNAQRGWSLTNVIEACLARELTKAGFVGEPFRAVFVQIREKRAVLPLELHASATFVRLVEVVDAIVAINGPGPNYFRWRKGVSAFLAQWTKKQRPLDTQILEILAGDRAAERGQVDISDGEDR
jgi:hypothetical protein